DLRTIEADLRLELARLRLEGLRLGIEIDEDHAAELLDPYGLEGEIAGVEILHPLLIAGRLQRTVEVIAPGVIGGEDDVGSAAALEQFMTAVLADIVEGAQLAGAVAQEDHAVARHPHRQEAARLGQLALVASVPPAACEDRGLLQFVDRWIEIEARR